MTAQTAEIEPVIAGALELLREQPNTALDVLAAAVAIAPEAPVTAEAQPFPKLPKHIELTAEARAAMKVLAGVFNSVEIKERRSLTRDEIDKLTAEIGVIGQISAVLGPRVDAIKETIRVHMDVAAEEAGIAVPKDKTGPDGEVIVAATPRDQNGHYLLAGPKDPHQVASGTVAWSQEYSSGSAKPSDGELQAAYQKGEIDKDVYMAITRSARSFDQARFLAFLRRDPRRGLAALRRITKRGTPQSALYLRKQT
jgi:hypothetical protein